MSRGGCIIFRAALDRGDLDGPATAHAERCARCARELATARALRAALAHPDRSVPPAFARRVAVLARLDAAEWGRTAPRRATFPTPAFTWSLAAVGLACAAVVAWPYLYDALATGVRELVAGSRTFAGSLPLRSWIASLGDSLADAVAVPSEVATLVAGTTSFAAVLALFVVRRARMTI